MAEQQGQQISPEQIQEVIAEALQQGVPREEIVNGLSADLGIDPGQAEQLVAAVEQQGGGGQTGEPKLDGMSLDEAMSKLEGLTDPETLISILEIVLALTPSDIDALYEAVGGAKSEASAQEQAPPQEDQMMI